MRSLTNKRKAELEAIFKKAYPNWNGRVSGRRLRPTLYEGTVNMPRTLYQVPLSLQGMDCCGTLELSGVQTCFGSVLNKAVFEYWLHQPFQPERHTHTGTDVAALIATTAFRSFSNGHPIEPFLQKMGFKQVSSGLNPNSGNIVRVWVYAVAPPSPRP